jgi:hypothetical protein
MSTIVAVTDSGKLLAKALKLTGKVPIYISAKEPRIVLYFGVIKQ